MLFQKPDQVREPLYAIVPVQNPWRWRSRWKHTERAIKHFADSGAVVILVELAFNRREFAFENCGLHGTLVDCPDVLGTNHNYRHQFVGLRGTSELWLKENMINVGVSRIPNWNWQQVCWLDSDVMFARPNWVGECIHKLQHYAFLQMFSHARDLAPNYEMLPEDYPHADGRGFVDAFFAGKLFSDPLPINGKHKPEHPEHPDKPGKPPHPGHKPPKPPKPEYEGPYGARVFPGLAWACTRKAWDDVGGLLDVAIWGGGDWHMAHALIEKTEGMMRSDLHRNYKKIVMQWYYRCHTHIRRNVGVMEGSIFHNWHGKKSQRGYNVKHGLLAKVGFDPLRHLKRDMQNLYQLHDDRSTAFVKLRDILRKIAKERNEDSIDV
jgi:hypothetical protein